MGITRRAVSWEEMKWLLAGAVIGLWISGAANAQGTYQHITQRWTNAARTYDLGQHQQQQATQQAQPKGGAGTCPNLSGRYLGANGLPFVVKQDGCSHFAGTDPDGVTGARPLDGKFRKLYNTTNDVALYGESEFEEHRLVFKQLIVNDGRWDGITITFMHLDDGGNLVVQSRSFNDVMEITRDVVSTHKRIEE